MVARQKFALRRLRLDELVAKLAQIEEQASLTLSESPRLIVERQRLIIGIAKQVQSHLEDQIRRGEREPEPVDRQSRLDAEEAAPAASSAKRKAVVAV